MKSYSVSKIDGTTASVVITLDDGTTYPQSIANMPTGDATAFDAAMRAYVDAFAAGKAIEAAAAAAKVAVSPVVTGVAVQVGDPVIVGA